MNIDGRQIGPGRPCYVVAEMSANHHQGFDRACAIIRAAREAGADAVKLQTYTPDTLTIDCDNEHFRLGDHPLWGGRTLYELYRQACMPWDWYPRLKAVARDAGITLFSTPFDETAVDFLEGQGAPAYKVASFELVDVPLLKKVAATGKPVILSTGMATLEEISLAVRALRAGGTKDLALLKCSSAYPADPAEMNLRTIPDLAEKFGAAAGLSDHTTGSAAAVAAVALGACLVEKHFTLPGQAGPDDAFSVGPAEFARMVADLRAAEQALGTVFYGHTKGEEGSIRFRRSLFAVADIARGERFTPGNVRVIRPGQGLAPVHYEAVLGRQAARDIPRGTPLRWDLVEGLVLRPATMDDAERLYAWAMDAETRRQSFNPAGFGFESHCLWLEKQLASPGALCLIGMDAGVPVATIRFEKEGEAAVPSFAVAPEARGRGYGTAVLAAGARHVIASGFAARVKGFVKLANPVSIRCFEKAGFARGEDADVRCSRCAVFEWTSRS